MSDLLTQALMPIIEKSIKDGIEAYDIMSLVTNAVKEASGIASKNITLTDTKGIVKNVKLAHKQLEDLLLMVDAKIPVLLVGEAGSAKSHSVEQVAGLLGLDFYAMSVAEQSTKSHLEGFIDANGNYHTTEFRKAFEEGGLFLLDEMDAGNSNTLLTLNTAIANGYAIFPDGKIYAHEKFTLVASANTFGNGSTTQYVGRNKLDVATRNRFVSIEWETDWDIYRVLANNESWFELFMETRDLIYLSVDDVLLGSRNLLYGAKLLAKGMDIEKVINLTVMNVLSIDDKEIIDVPLLAGRYKVTAPNETKDVTASNDIGEVKGDLPTPEPTPTPEPEPTPEPTTGLKLGGFDH